MMKEKINTILENCHSSWGNDEKTTNLEERIHKWIDPVETEEEKLLLLELMNNFNYYPRNLIPNIFRDLNENFYKKATEPDYTLYLPMFSKNGKYNHSFEMIKNFQIGTQLASDYFITNPTEAQNSSSYPLNQIKNIVIIDDFIGTGNTFKKFIRHLNSNYPKLVKGKNLYLIVVEICDFGLEKIKQYLKKESINVTIIPHKIHKKAFHENHIFDSKHATSAREIIKQRETAIGSSYILGYEESEALLAFYYNTPNNTLSIFWHENHRRNWNPLFPRNKFKKPIWQKKTGNFNYNMRKKINSKKGNNNG